MSKKESSNGNGGWAELRLEPRELILPRTHVDSEDEIPTLPDLDELQDALEKEVETISAPAVAEKWTRPDSGTYAELEAEEVHLGNVSLAPLLTHVRSVAGAAITEVDEVWTVASLLQDLSEKPSK